MVKLEKRIKKSVFDYEQIERTETKAIYSQSYNGKIISYEVFRIKVVKECILFDNIIPEHEKFPSDNDFGITAWSIRDYKKALDKYNGIK